MGGFMKDPFVDECEFCVASGGRSAKLTFVNEYLKYVKMCLNPL